MFKFTGVGDLIFTFAVLEVCSKSVNSGGTQLQSSHQLLPALNCDSIFFLACGEVSSHNSTGSSCLV